MPHIIWLRIKKSHIKNVKSRVKRNSSKMYAMLRMILLWQKFILIQLRKPTNFGAYVL